MGFQHRPEQQNEILILRKGTASITNNFLYVHVSRYSSKNESRVSNKRILEVSLAGRDRPLSPVPEDP